MWHTKIRIRGCGNINSKTQFTKNLNRIEPFLCNWTVYRSEKQARKRTKDISTSLSCTAWGPQGCIAHKGRLIHLLALHLKRSLFHSLFNGFVIGTKLILYNNDLPLGLSNLPATGDTRGTYHETGLPLSTPIKTSSSIKIKRHWWQIMKHFT